jgi:hypothetical protein
MFACLQTATRAAACSRTHACAPARVQLDVDAAGAARYSTAPPWAQEPDAPPQRWTHHWRQCVAFLPGAGLPLRAGQRLTLRASHDDHSIWFHVDASPPPAAVAAADVDAAPLPLSRPPPDAAHAARLGSRERVWQLNDERYASALRAGAAAALAAAPHAACDAHSPLRVAVLGDGPLLSRIAAALPRAAAVTALVSTPEQLVVVARAASAASASASASASARTAPVRAALASRFLRDADGAGACADDGLREGVFDVALAEPYYALLDTCALPWAPACHFWRELSALRARGALARDAPVAPARATLHARLVALPELAASRAAVGDVCGVDVSRANALLRPPHAAADDADVAAGAEEQALAGAFPVQLFQVAAGGFRPLSDPVQFATLPFATSDWAPLAGTAQLRVHAQEGRADALLLWVSYESGGAAADGCADGCADGADDASCVSGAPPMRPPSPDAAAADDGRHALAPGFQRQAVALLRRGVRVAAGDVARVAWELDETLALRVSFAPPSCSGGEEEDSGDDDGSGGGGARERLPRRAAKAGGEAARAARKGARRAAKAAAAAARAAPAEASFRPCHLCAGAHPLLVRCRMDASGAWRFVCGRCWVTVSGGGTDGDAAHPHYRYGGEWRAFKR